jgi:small-conductance mechanosensitive channel
VKTILHATFGILSFGFILISMMVSLIVEIWYSHEEIAVIKESVFDVSPYFLGLIVSTAFLGWQLGKTRNSEILKVKKKRMLWIFAATVLILLPIAYLLNGYAMQEQYDLLYFVLQSIEYVVDVIVLILMGLNIRDGGRLIRESQETA